MTNKAEKIGVLAAGTMGAGIAQVSAQAGFETQLYDISQEFIDKGLGRIRSFLQGSRERGKMTAEAEKETLERLHGTIKLEDFKGYSLIIEAAPETLELKRKIFQQLDSLCGPETFAASTREIADRIARAPRSIGLIKRAVNHAALPQLEADLEYEAYLQEVAGRSADYDDGVRAFLEKRAPAFTGK